MQMVSDEAAGPAAAGLVGIRGDDDNGEGHGRIFDGQPRPGRALPAVQVWPHGLPNVLLACTVASTSGELYRVEAAESCCMSVTICPAQTSVCFVNIGWAELDMLASGDVFANMAKWRPCRKHMYRMELLRTMHPLRTEQRTLLSMLLTLLLRVEMRMELR